MTATMAFAETEAHLKAHVAGMRGAEARAVEFWMEILADKVAEDLTIDPEALRDALVRAANTEPMIPIVLHALSIHRVGTRNIPRKVSTPELDDVLANDFVLPMLRLLERREPLWFEQAGYVGSGS